MCGARGKKKGLPSLGIPECPRDKSKEVKRVQQGTVSEGRKQVLDMAGLGGRGCSPHPHPTPTHCSQWLPEPSQLLPPRHTLTLWGRGGDLVSVSRRAHIYQWQLLGSSRP